MLSPIITQYIIADRADEARRHAAHARLARRSGRDAGGPPDARAPVRRSSRWRAWSWSLTPRAFGSARLPPR